MASVLSSRLGALMLFATAVDGLEIDGEPATPASLVERGPEELFREALAAVKAECGLSDEQRKN